VGKGYPDGLAVEVVYRYPVKSMLGEALDRLAVDERGAEGDRRLAVVDAVTGRVASAKHPRLWRALLTVAAAGPPGEVRLTASNGTSFAAADPGIDEWLSELLGRPVHLAGRRQPGAEVLRAVPEDVLANGVDAEVDYTTLEIGQGTPGDSFVDYAPLHLITTATVGRVGAEALRYRPNLLVSTPDGWPAWSENDWVGREVRIGEVRLRAMLPTPRCAVPTLEHGSLPRAPHATRTPMAQNRVEVPGFGVLPCAGVYLQVLSAGTVRVGDPVSVGEPAA
jgi:uncharacterized protein